MIESCPFARPTRGNDVIGGPFRYKGPSLRSTKNVGGHRRRRRGPEASTRPVRPDSAVEGRDGRGVPGFQVETSGVEHAPFIVGATADQGYAVDVDGLA